MKLAYVYTVLFVLLIGMYIGYHMHPSLTVFCPREHVVDVTEADAPMGNSTGGFLEFKKYESTNLFRSWFYKPVKGYRTDCSAFLYE